MAEPSPASADTVINGCTIVSNPTTTNFTNCPGADLSAADLSGVDLSFADLAGAAFVTCNFFAVTCSAGNLTGANLTDANLSKAGFFNSTTLPPPGHGSASAVAPLNNAIMTGADLSGANMESGQLAGANMTSVNATGTNLGFSNFTDANLTDANLTDATTGADNWTGVILAGAVLTGTDLLPQSPETWIATSDAGAVVTWQPLVGVSGLTSGPCTPASGSTFPVNTTTTVTCQILDDFGNAASGTFLVTVVPTDVILPSYLGNVSGLTNLDATAFDAAGFTKVLFELNGGGFTNQVIATGTPTLYGWLAQWNTTTVPDNAYSIVAVATDANNVTYDSAPDRFGVSNGSPMTKVLVPSNGASVSGTSSVLNASASPYVTSVTYELFGGPSNLNGQVVATGTPTYYGWLSHWNTTTVPNGTYSLESVAAYASGQQGFSTLISIKVNNPLPATSILIPAQATTLSGSTTLDATGSNATSVEFLLFGGTYGFAAPVVCTATLTYYGWVCDWNTSTVPNGSYVLVSEAFNSAGSAFSTGVSVTVNN
jgi:uncharacterized protein YjbI with pentapeptide repeats